MNPIITSLLDTDFYKFTMAQVAYRRHWSVPVTYAFKNRTSSVRLAEIVSEADLRRELGHVRDLRLKDDELDFLKESRHIPHGLFAGEFLDFLAGLHLPDYDLSVEDGQFKIEVSGPWPKAIFWETFILSVVNELYNRALLAKDGGDSRVAWTEGRMRLMRKLRTLALDAPTAKVIEFGTRRRDSRGWQDKVVMLTLDKFPQLLLGTSNVALAKKYSIPPIGTMAHEMFMVYSGIYHKNDDEIRSSHNRVLQTWWNEYGVHLSVALSDTYGSEFFFRDMSAEQARNWKGLRQDSGDPFAFGERVIEFYKSHGVDPATRLIVFSDGLDVEKIIALYKRFDGRIQTSFGWGTDLTNDTGYKPLSLVVKAVKSCGHPTVKISDNPAKATGPAEEVERFKRIFGTDGGVYEACRV